MESEAQGSAYEYLYATIMTADWITSGYKSLAEKYRNHPSIKDLYMCICDGVNLDLLELITIDDDTSELLVKCRKQSLESDFTRKYQEAIDRITVITKTTEHELKSLSGTVKHIAENIPVKEEPFYIPVEEDGKLEQFLFGEDISDNVDVPNFGTNTTKENLAEENTEFVSVQCCEKKENFLHRFRCRCSFLFKGKPKRTIISMLEQGYKDEQITFLLKCMEEGMTEREIDEIAAPELSVQHMELLKRIKRREQERNGIR